jgi:cobalamin biosynthesis Mg chelatase CobN
MTPLFQDVEGKEGKFTCGIKTMYNKTSSSTQSSSSSSSFLKEYRKFVVPLNLTCKKCVVQFAVYADFGNFYQCSDILIQPNTNLEDLCEASCSERGVCVDGKCQCLSGYHGKFCQYSSKSKKEKNNDYSDTIQIMFFIILLVLVLLVLCVGVYYWREAQEDLRKEKIRRLEFENEKSLEKIKNYECGSFTKRAIIE